MPSKSKNKGNALEREVRDILNKAYETEEFARTPNSGAIMGLSNYERNQGLSESTKATLGSDLICPEWFKFSVECKWYADKPNYAQIIKGSDSDLDGWLGEACFDAQNLGLWPMLVFKTNRKGTHVAIPNIFWSQLKMDVYLMYRPFVIFGVDTFVANAEKIRDDGKWKMQDHSRRPNEWPGWIERDDVQALIAGMKAKKGKK